MPVVTTPACLICGLSSQVTLTVAEYDRLLRSGPHDKIQDLLPERAAGERELLISGTHPACWDLAFPDEED